MSDGKSLRTEWTHEQLAAIKCSGGNILVSAAAGSGKTSVLTERILRKIANEGADISRFLVVTFTKSAAAEMKSRLVHGLQELMWENPGDIRLKRQQMKVAEAHICTIDSYCLDLIKKYSTDTQLSIGTKMATESDCRILLNKAVDDVIESEYEKDDEDFYALTQLLNSGNNDNKMKSSLHTVYDSMRLHPFPDEWKKHALKAYDESDYSDYSRNIWLKNVYAEVKTASEYYSRRFDSLITRIEPGSVTDGNYGEVGRELSKHLKSLAAAADMEDYGECASLILNMPARKFAGNKEKGCDEHKESMKNLKSRMIELFRNLGSSYFRYDADALKEEASLLRPAVAKLLDMADAVDNRYLELKRERSICDFADLEIEALRLLWKRNENGEISRSEVSEVESDCFDEILIDEYQDVNSIQDLIFRGLESPEKGNLFIVGDIKQGIYRFRGACPELFLERRKKYVPFSDDAEFPMLIPLGKNFRSRREITDAVNTVFSAIMSEKTCGMDYSEEDKLYPCAVYEDYPEAGAYLTLAQSEKDMSQPETEAKYVAQRIRELIDSGYTVKGADGTMRELRYGDIAILLRAAKNKSEVFAETLSAAGIPAVDVSTSGYLSSPSVMRMIALLRTIDNPMRDINLTAAMYSGMFGFTESELLRIRAGSDGALYYAVKAAADAGDEKSAGFLKKLAVYREKAGMLTADKLIWYIYSTTGYLSYASTLTNGKRERKSLMRLFSKAQAYGSTGRQDLSGFVLYMDKVIAQGVSDDRSAGTVEGDEVSILTVHKSKGLEFPVCFVCLTNGKNPPMGDNLYVHSNLGVAMKMFKPRDYLVAKSMPFSVITRRIKNDDIAEEMRMLYVAMTRAKERLEIVGSHTNWEKAVEDARYRLDSSGCLLEYDVKDAKNWMSWLLPVALGTSVFRINAFYGGVPEASESGDADAACPSANELPDADASLTDSIYERLIYNYPHSAAVNIPTKLTVSEIVAARSGGENTQGDCCVRKPACMTGGRVGAAEAGTALHAFLQFADYGRLGDIEGEIERLVEKRFITRRQADAIDRRKAEAFAASELFARIRAAESLRREFRFTEEIVASDYIEGAPCDEKLLIQGAIDCVFKEADKYIIVDYKTDRISGNIAEKTEHYRPQLEAYARAFGELTGESAAEGILYFLDADRTVSLW